MRDAQTFWHTVFGDMPEGMRAVLVRGDTWSGVKAESFPGQRLTAWVKQRFDIYIRCTYVSTDLDVNQGRGTAQDAMGMPGLWIDLDYGDHGNEKKYPPDKSRALMVVDSLKYQPSVILHTGHGIHAWWLFREPWTFDTNDEREHAAKIVDGWQRHIIASISQAPLRWTMDITSDLPRVLRIPDTFNYKHGEQVPVTLERLTDLRYNPGDFEEWVGLAKDQNTAKTVDDTEYPAGTFVINLDADFPPARKLKAWLDLDEKFKRTWNKKRDTDMNDQSASGYDLALANAGVAFGCTDQEIVDMCITWRSLKELDSKKNITRESYWRDTLKKARYAQQTEHRDAELEHKLDELLTVVDTYIHPSDPRFEELKQEAFGWFLDRYGVPYQKLICEMPDDGSNGNYIAILTDGRRIVYGPVANILSQKKFIEITVDALGQEMKTLRRVKEPAWDKRVRLFIAVREIERIGAESNGHAMILEWLTDYLYDQKPFIVKDVDERSLFLSERRSIENFIENEHAWFRLDRFVKWLDEMRHLKYTARELGGWLRSRQVTYEVVNYKNGTGKTVPRRFWRVSLDQVPVTGNVFKPLKPPTYG